MKLTEAQRSAARRKAGRRLEREHMMIVRRLRVYYDQAKYHALWGDKFNARRTEAIRADLMAQNKEQYKAFLKEEEANIRHDLPPVHNGWTIAGDGLD